MTHKSSNRAGKHSHGHHKKTTFQAFCEGRTSENVTKMNEMEQSPIPSIDGENGETVGEENNEMDGENGENGENGETICEENKENEEPTHNSDQ